MQKIQREREKVELVYELKKRKRKSFDVCLRVINEPQN